MPTEKSQVYTIFNLYSSIKIMDKHYYVYILASNRLTLYVGVTNNLARRIQEHKEKVVPGFTRLYNITILVYAESFNNIKEAILREKQIKKYSRSKKMTLIKTINPGLKDLSKEVLL